jgi:hypothetical protein
VQRFLTSCHDGLGGRLSKVNQKLVKTPSLDLLFCPCPCLVFQSFVFSLCYILLSMYSRCYATLLIVVTLTSSSSFFTSKMRIY